MRQKGPNCICQWLHPLFPKSLNYIAESHKGMILNYGHKTSQNPHKNEKDLFSSAKACMPITWECVLETRSHVLSSGEGGRTRCAWVETTHGQSWVGGWVGGGENLAGRWGLGPSSTFHFLPEAGRLGLPGWDNVVLWDAYFLRFKTVHRIHTKTCVLFACNEFRVVPGMYQDQVKSMPLRLILQRWDLLHCSELPNSRFAARLTHQYVGGNCCPPLYLVRLASFFFLYSELFLP